MTDALLTGLGGFFLFIGGLMLWMGSDCDAIRGVALCVIGLIALVLGKAGFK